MGCRLNSWESNKINNFIRDDKKNDLMIFNSCCVTNDAVKSLKKNIKLFYKSNPNVKIVVTGCAVESERHNIENMEEVSYIVKNKDKLLKKNWESLQDNISVKNKINLEFKNLHRENPSNSNIRKFVKIQNGCDHSCTFCIIPSCRGKSISESVKKIIEGNQKASIKLIVYESLTCGGCANFHKNIYPELKDSFLVTALVSMDVKKVNFMNGTNTQESLFSELDDLKLIVKAGYVSFSVGGRKGVAYLNVQKNGFKMHIRRGHIMNDGTKSKGYFTIDDPKKISKTKSWTWKSGAKGVVYEIRLDKNFDIDYIKFLIKQKYNSIIN